VELKYLHVSWGDCLDLPKEFVAKGMPRLEDRDNAYLLTWNRVTDTHVKTGFFPARANYRNAIQISFLEES